MTDAPLYSPANGATLSRKLGLLGLSATGICSMLGASIYVVPFMIQRHVPGIGPYVLPAFLLAAVPALFAAMAYAMLASAMPRAGGSYVYASRGLHPYLGFVASFSQWFGLSIAIGVVAYIIIPFLRDIAGALQWTEWASWLDLGPVRVGLALTLLWWFVAVNMLGARWYQRTLIPLMFLMFGLGAIVIVAGFAFDHADFAAAVAGRDGPPLPVPVNAAFKPGPFLSAAALLFASFIGFDSIAQAGGEARRPERNLPLAIAIAILSVGSFYMVFTSAVYHAVPWQFVAAEAAVRDITAPGLLRYLLPGAGAAAIIAGAAIALINDLPAMLLAVSRLLFAWAEDGIFPRWIARIHPRRHTPTAAILLSGTMATVGVLGSHLAGDFFLGIDIMVTSMLVNFLLMCLTVATLPRRNPRLAAEVKVLKNRRHQLLLAGAGSLLLTLFLIIHLQKDLATPAPAWYFHSTPVWLIVMALASLLFAWQWKNQKAAGADLQRRFAELPPE